MSIFSMFAVTGKRLLDLLDDQEVTPPPPQKKLPPRVGPTKNQKTEQTGEGHSSHY